MSSSPSGNGFGKRNALFSNILSTSVASESSGGFGEDLHEDDIWGSNDAPSIEDSDSQDDHSHSISEQNSGYRPGIQSLHSNNSTDNDLQRLSRKGPTSGWIIPTISSSTTKRAISRQSAPVNIPDWSKIIGVSSKHEVEAVSDEEDDSGPMVPPHEILAKEYAQSVTFSVYSGAGRTLRGRDLNSVRTAVLRQTGFLDS